jgi:hypothetical protein
MRRGLARFKLVGPALPVGGFTLYRVTAPPLRRHWYAAIAAGPRPGLTALGTPVRRLSLEDASASVSLLGDAPGSAGPGPVTLRLKVRNSGTVDWPVLAGSDAGNFGSSAWMLHPFTVYLEARWARLSKSAGEPDAAAVYNMILNRDVEAREALTQELSIPRPPAAGRYLLELCVAQKDGPRLAELPSRVLRLEIELSPAGPEEIPEVADQFF